jgi:uncharacterized protein (DUF58 family)
MGNYLLAEEPHDHLNSRQFELAVKKLSDSLSYGSYNSIFLGGGLEYAQSRLYVAGDPVRSIDWRVTGRTGRYHIKEYEAPKRMPVYFVIDTSASMCITSQKLSKYAWALQIATGMALAAQQHMSPTGFISCGERDLHLRPTLSQSSIMQTAHKLRYYRLDEKTLLAETCKKLAPILENRSLVVVISDFNDEDAIKSMRILAAEHDCVALHLIDPAEFGRTKGGLYRAQEAENSVDFVATGRCQWLDFDQLHKLIRRSGIDLLSLPIDKPILPPLKDFMNKRCHLRRG